ncbi:hypothetical protein ADEAN_000018500 [Angomonas deanei]|uniref:Uncharacterized protein n=1 Tax=Angomonas deanei TaxID=59799 RepID=A0A7G2C217_9TRYP|nr:hypothetical protein ADEAN_000018500 [Angomonas deanei]
MAMAIIAFFSVMLAMLFRGCRRLYLLTDQRLITVYEGIAKPIITFTDLKSVKYACIHGYNANSFGLFKFLRGLLMMSKGQFMRLVRQCRRKEGDCRDRE